MSTRLSDSSGRSPRTSRTILAFHKREGTRSAPPSARSSVWVAHWAPRFSSSDTPFCSLHGSQRRCRVADFDPAPYFWLQGS